MIPQRPESEITANKNARTWRRAWSASIGLSLLLGLDAMLGAGMAMAGSLDEDFTNPPATAKPWVYWYFMDGNLSREGMTADLEAMKKAGIGGAIFLEVNIGVPRGNVDFMSPPWQDLFAQAVHEADRLGVQIALGSGPGWCGTGGPWIKPELSMQHLVASETNVTGPAIFWGRLPRPEPRTPYFGEGTLSPELKKEWQEFYRDVAVLAFRTPNGTNRLADVEEKALYHRDAYSSMAGVKPFLPAPADYPEWPVADSIQPADVVNLSGQLVTRRRTALASPGGTMDHHAAGADQHRSNHPSSTATGAGFRD